MSKPECVVCALRMTVANKNISKGPLSFPGKNGVCAVMMLIITIEVSTPSAE
jgi:hypothetical protein